MGNSAASYLIANENSALPFGLDVVGNGLKGFTTTVTFPLGASSTSYPSSGTASSVDPTHPSSYDIQQAAKDDISNHNLQSVSGDRGLGMINVKSNPAEGGNRRCAGDSGHDDLPAAVAVRDAVGFTLIELLVVILIILLVSAVALPVVLPAHRHRQVSEAARILQATLAGRGIRRCKSGTPSGIRLLPDPAFPLIYTAPTARSTPPSRWPPTASFPIEAAPEYTEGAADGRGEFGNVPLTIPYPAINGGGILPVRA